MHSISIVIPVLDDAPALRQLLDDLDRVADADVQRIVVDGGSRDGTREVAHERVDCVLRTPPGRARQLAAGIAVARGGWVWMLHADTRVDRAAWHALTTAIDVDGAAWGRFDVRLSGHAASFRMIETLMNVRSRWSAICTGDQGIFVRRELLEMIGGLPDQPLMEDVELTKRLRRHARPICIRTPLVTSSRRWELRGIVPTILLMWRLRLRYFFGASPETLAREYYDDR